MSSSDRSQLVYGFVLINMKKTIMPYTNQTNPLITSKTIPQQSTTVAGGAFPPALLSARTAVLKSLDAFCDTINSCGSAKELYPAFGTASELPKRNTMFEDFEKAFTTYRTLLETFAGHGWNPPDAVASAVAAAGEKAMDPAMEAVMADCMPAMDGSTVEGAAKASKAGAAGIRSDPKSTANLSPFYFFWTNCLGDNSSGGGGGRPTHAIADWRYEVASLHFNAAVIYLSCAAYLAFLISATSHANYFSSADAALASRYASTGATALMEKEAYAHCCSAAYHYERAAALMKEVMGVSASSLTSPSSGSEGGGGAFSSSGTDSVFATLTAAAAASSAGTSPTGDKDVFHSKGSGSTTTTLLGGKGGDGSAAGGASGEAAISSSALLVAGGVTKSHVPVDMTLPFLTLMREVLVGQAQEISVAKAIRAGRDDASVSKMTFTSLAGRLMLGARLTFANAEAATQKDLVVMKAGFSSFVAAIQTKAAGYEALAYALQGAYMAVPITNSQRMEIAILERERAAAGGGNSNAAAVAAIGPDAGANPEEGLWCLARAAELAKALPDRARQSGCAPAVRVWLTFVIQKYIVEVQSNITELQRMGLTRKPAVGPVALKPGMVIARPRAPARVPEK